MPRIASGVKPPPSYNWIEATDKKGAAALRMASAGGHVPTVKTLLGCKANIHAKDKGGWTALHFASQNGHEPIVKLLLEHGVDINGALQIACWNGKDPVAKHLSKYGAEVNGSLIMWATRRCDGALQMAFA